MNFLKLGEAIGTSIGTGITTAIGKELAAWWDKAWKTFLTSPGEQLFDENGRPRGRSA